MKVLIQYISKQFGKPSGIGGQISTFLMNCLNRKLYHSIIQNLKIDKRDTILDIGFGNGFLLKKVAEQNPNKVLGIEISKDMLWVAGKRNAVFIQNGKVELTESNVMNLPFADSSIDKIYTVNTIYFWKDCSKGFSEIFRVLKSDGLFLNAVYTKKWLDKLPITRYGFVKFTATELKELIERNGFSEVQIIEIQKNKSLCIVAKKS